MADDEVPPRYTLGISSIPAEENDEAPGDVEEPEPPEPSERAE